MRNKETGEYMKRIREESKYWRVLGADQKGIKELESNITGEYLERVRDNSKNWRVSGAY